MLKSSNWNNNPIKRSFLEGNHDNLGMERAILSPSVIDFHSKGEANRHQIYDKINGFKNDDVDLALAGSYHDENRNIKVEWYAYDANKKLTTIRYIL